MTYCISHECRAQTGCASRARIRCRFFGNKEENPTLGPSRATLGVPLRLWDGGEGGIRTHDTLSRIPVFETGTFNRSVTSPICARILQRESSTRGIDGLE